MMTTSNHVKYATIGGDQETGFEQSFASLGWAFIKDKAPRLLDFMVGFQLVERNDDNTKAVGVFGFKVGNQWLYAPVFFLNGDLKGHELLYIKNQDMFVPMKENWINYIIGRKPHLLGEGSQKDVWQLGALAPNIERLSYPPARSKFGSDRLTAEWAKPFLPVLAALRTKQARFLYRHAPHGRTLNLAKMASDISKSGLGDIPCDLAGLIHSDYNVARVAWNAYKQFPAIKQAFDTFHGPTFFSAAAQQLYKAAMDTTSRLIVPADRVPTVRGSCDSIIPTEKNAAADKPKVTIVTDDDVAVKNNLPELTGEEKQQVHNHGYLVKDERSGEEVSIAYNTTTRQSLDNPHESGIYDLLESPGEFGRMLVITKPYTNAGTNNFCTVIRLGDGEKSWLNAHNTALFAKRIDLPEEDYQKWFDGVDGGGKPEKGGTYIYLSPTGQGTTPFRVRETYENDRFMVDFQDSLDYRRGRNENLPKTLLDNNRLSTGCDYVSTYDALIVRNSRKDSKLRAIGGELHVPDTFKLFKLKDPPKPKKDSDSLIPETCCGECGSDPKPISPGDLRDVQLLFTEKTARMKLYGDHHEVTITTKTGSDRLSWKSALFNLVTRHGLREKQAELMLKEAQQHRSAVYRIKYADNYPLPGPGPTSPLFPSPEYGSEQRGYNATQAIYPQEDFMPVPGLDSSRTDPRVYDPFLNITPDSGAMQTAQSASQQGQKEIFDTTMLAGLLKTVRPENQVDRYLGDLMKALDRLGRMLMLFYWHGDDFAEQYGSESQPEMEDSLRNAFESLGDLTLSLRESSINPSLDDIGSPNADDVAKN